METNIESIKSILTALESASNFASKYGPFFFACALLVVTPFVATLVFKRTIDGSRDAEVRNSAYQDFRFYFRSTVALGLFCVLVGVAWWAFANVRQSAVTEQAVMQLKSDIAKYEQVVETYKDAIKRRKFVILGIVTGVEPNDEFFPGLTPGMTMMFSRLEPKELLFYVMSDTEIPKNLIVNIGYRQFDQSTKLFTRFSNVPLFVEVSETMPGRYQFEFITTKEIAAFKPK